jgi:DNA primase
MYAILLDQEYQRELFGDLPGFQRRGPGFIACCPFHKEHMPTLLIYGDRPEYFCFSCSERGDWLKFMMQRYKIPFEEALSRIPHISKIRPDDFRKGQWEKTLSRMIFLETAMCTFITQLWSKQGEDVLHFLFKRGYAMGEVEGMSLGYYPGFTQTRQSLLSQGIAKHDLDTVFSGLWKNRTDNAGLAIPYRDTCGRLMGIIFRDISNTGHGAYKPLTDNEPLEDVPFLMYRSRGQREIIVVEGFFDALLIDQVRLKPVIGIGTNGLTGEQIDTAVFYGTRHFILAFGSGSRQKDITRETIKKIHERSLTASIVPIPPEYKDLDEFIRMTCLDHFKALLKKIINADTWLESGLKG